MGAAVTSKRQGVDLTYLTTEQDIADRVLGAKLTNPYGLGLTSILGFIGNEEMVSSDDDITFYERDRPFDNVKVASDVADPGVGNQILIPLHSDSLDANNNFFVREGHILQFANGAQGMVVDIDVSTPAIPVLEVEPVDTAVNIGALSEDDELAIVSEASAEATGKVKPMQRGFVPRKFYMQIIKSSGLVTGSALANALKVQITENGEKFDLYKDVFDSVKEELERLKDGAVVWGQKDNNPNLLQATSYGNSNVRKTTKGLVPTIDALGGKLPVTAGAFDMDVFDDIDLFMTRNGAPSGYALMPMGKQLFHDVENALKEYTDKATDFAKVSQFMTQRGVAGMEVALNFSAFTKSNRTFILKSIDAWTDPKLFGNDFYDQEKWGMVLPLFNVADAKTGKMSKNVSVLHKGLGAYSRRLQLKVRDGSGVMASQVLDDDVVEVTASTHCGFKGLAMQSAIMLRNT